MQFQRGSNWLYIPKLFPCTSLKRLLDMTKPLDATSSFLNNSLQMLIFIYQWNWREKNIYHNCDVCSGEIQRPESSFPCSLLQLKTPWCVSAAPLSPVLRNPWYTLQSSLLLPTVKHHFGQLRIYKLPHNLDQEMQVSI